MKKIILLAVAFLFLMTTTAFGASVTVSSDTITADGKMRTLVISCVGDIDNTNLTPSTSGLGMSRTLIGWYPWRIIVENLAATTVTDNSDVYLKNTGDTDLLDGAGVDQLDNTTRNEVDIHSCNPIEDVPYLDVDNQAEATGAFTVTIIFVK